MSPQSNPWADPSNPQYNLRFAADMAAAAQEAHESSVPYQVALQQRHTDAAEGHGVSPEVLGLMDQGVISAWGEPASYGFGPTYGEAGRQGGTPMDSAGLDYSNSGGVPWAANWQDFKGNASTGGGFFTADEQFGEVPASFQSGSTLPSTNNWRLLPPDFRRPGFIMRNGQIIGVHAYDVEHPFGKPGIWYSSGAQVGVPSALGPASGGFNYTAQGWPGRCRHGRVSQAYLWVRDTPFARWKQIGPQQTGSAVSRPPVFAFTCLGSAHIVRGYGGLAHHL
jgi:hypothetical protein